MRPLDYRLTLLQTTTMSTKTIATVSKTSKARLDLLCFMMRHPYGPGSVRKTRAAQRSMLREGQPHQNVKVYQMHWNMNFEVGNYPIWEGNEPKEEENSRSTAFKCERIFHSHEEVKTWKEKREGSALSHLPGKSNRRWRGGRSRWGCSRCRGRWGERRRWRSRWSWWGGGQRGGRCGWSGGGGGGPSCQEQLKKSKVSTWVQGEIGAG